MKAKIYIPYANGDCVRGFKHDKEISVKEYVKMETDEYYKHKNDVSDMMYSQFGQNMSRNNLAGRADYRGRRYKQQTYYYHECPCMILNIDGKDATLSEIDKYYRNEDKFVLIVHLNRDVVGKNPDLETDVNMWITESLKINNCNRLTDEEKLIHLPKKDIKVKFDEDKSTAVLKDCKLLQKMGSNTSFAIMVGKIVFVKD